MHGFYPEVQLREGYVSILPFRLSCVVFCSCASALNIERMRIEQGLHFPKAAMERQKDMRALGGTNYTIPRQIPVTYAVVTVWAWGQKQS